MINFYQKTLRKNKLKTLDSFEAGSWVYVEEPVELELRNLANQFDLDIGLLRDAVDINEAPRMELDGDLIYIFARIPFSEDDRTQTVPVLVVLGKDFLITISKKALPFLGKFLGEEIDFTTTQKVKLFLQIFSLIDSTYSKALADIQRRVRGISVNLEQITNKDIIQFVTFENVLNDFISALVPTNSILNNLLSGKLFKLFKEDEDLVEDLMLSNGQLVEACKNALRTIVNIRTSYSAIMTNNLNRIIKLLTALTIVLAVPTMIASFYGMNVSLPMAQNPNAFWILVWGDTLLAGVLLGVFIKYKWL